MGLMDAFKANENKQLKNRVAELEAMLNPEQQNVVNLRDEIARLEQTAEQKRKEIEKTNDEAERLCRRVEYLNSEIEKKKSQSLSFDEMLMFETFGLYTPRFSFTKSEQYKQRLDAVRKQQKDLISSNKAVTGSQNWTVNGSLSEGKKMVKDMQKLLLRAFNSECDELVEKVKYNNFDASLKRINSSCDAISKLGRMMNISISQAYRQLKIDELMLAFEYAVKKQEEKEAEKEERARLREEAKFLKEIEEKRQKLEKEQSHYINALLKLNEQLLHDPNNADLLAKKAELESQKTEIEKAIKDVDYRMANKRVGYVYVISNVGAFGENVYKIGMTRRDKPQERVDELGDASVPFDFDIHAMIFTEDAPKLEAALHKAFEDKKVNMVNPRREFFRVSLDEIKEVVRKNYDKTVEFTDYADAEEWRISTKMRKGESSMPVFPQKETVNTPSVKNASTTQLSPIESAVNHIRSFSDKLECDVVNEYGVDAVYISENGKKLGRLRISTKHNSLRCDYTDFKTGRLYFIHKPEDCLSLIGK